MILNKHSREIISETNKVSEPKGGLKLSTLHESSIRNLDIIGCYEFIAPQMSDERGVFTKPFRRSLIDKKGVHFDVAESFYTNSTANVLRGMHFQLPPADQSKMVYCVVGRVLDVILDLRVGSPTFGQHVVFELSAAEHNAIYLPSGIAHGFYVLEAPALLIYSVTSEYAPALDSGVRWDSFGMRWPTNTPVVSDRDSRLQTLDTFRSPFIYSEVEKP